MASVESVKDELISTVFDAIRCLPADKQAAILLDTSLALIKTGQCGVLRLFFSSFNSLSRSRYGDQVENFLKVYLKIPGLPQEDLTKALLARGAARRVAAERLMGKAHQGTSILEVPSGADRRNADFQALSRLDPSNRQVKSLLQLSKQVSSCRCDVGLISLVFSPTRNQPAIGHPWKYGTGLLRAYLGITSGHGCSFRHSTVISPSDTSSHLLTFTLGKIKSTGIELSISSIG